MQKALKLGDAIAKLKDTDGSTEVIRYIKASNGSIDQKKANNWAVINTCAVNTLVFRMMLRAKKQRDTTGKKVRMPAILVKAEALLPMLADKSFMKMKTANKVTGSAITAKTLSAMFTRLISAALSFNIKLVIVGEIDKVNHFYSLFPDAFGKHKFDNYSSYETAADYFEII